MARIFTIRFTFNNASYNTLVTVRTTPFYMEYTLSNLDADLLLLLPGNTLISPSAGQLFFPNATTENSIALMKTIIQAVEEHLQSVTGTAGL